MCMHATSGSHMQAGGLGLASGSQRVAARSDRCAPQQDSLLPHAASVKLARLFGEHAHLQALYSQREQALDFATRFAGCVSAKCPTRMYGAFPRTQWRDAEILQFASLRQVCGGGDPLSSSCIDRSRSRISLCLWSAVSMRRAGLLGGKRARDILLTRQCARFADHRAVARNESTDIRLASIRPTHLHRGHISVASAAVLIYC